MADLSDDDILAQLGLEAEAPKAVVRDPQEERVIAGFEDIQRFFEEHRRIPRHGADNDIFERLYAVRLDRLRSREDCRTLLEPYDHQSLLEGPIETSTSDVEVDDEALLAELGVETGTSSITELKYVRSTAERRSAEEVANRQRCEDFQEFKPLFDKVQEELNAGLRETRPFEMKAEIEPGRFFIVGGQKAYVAEMGEVTLTDQGRTDARLRVIFDNATESNMLMRSLQRALNKDEAGRRITEPTAGPLFTDQTIEGDEPSGTIYVLRSKSDLPLVVDNRDLVHKIGVTNMSVEKRTAGARLQPTFLMADVEIVATYELFNINRSKLENLVHRIFEPARLEIEIKDRFGNPVMPREWFLVPLHAIDKGVELIRAGSISEYEYDPAQADFIRRP